MFDKKKIKKSLIILLLIAIIIIVIILLRRTLARYETTTSSDKDVDVAFWIVNDDFKTGKILIKDIYPSDKSFDYTFSVSNFKQEDNGSITKRAETDLQYELTFTMTTNLPLEYQIMKNGSIINNVEVWKKVFSDMHVIIPIIITVILFILLVSYKEKTGDENV